MKFKFTLFIKESDSKKIPVRCTGELLDIKNKDNKSIGFFRVIQSEEIVPEYVYVDMKYVGNNVK
jgi:hypothetical protein